MSKSWSRIECALLTDAVAGHERLCDWNVLVVCAFLNESMDLLGILSVVV